MLSNRAYRTVSTTWRSEHSFVDNFSLSCLLIPAALWVFTSQAAHPQEIETPVETAKLAKITPVPTATPAERYTSPDFWAPIEIERPAKPPIESELILEGLVSYGNYQIFAAGTDCKLFTAGAEYDRHSWGRFLGSQFDYVAEVLPFVLLDEPAKADIYGNPKSRNKQLVPGIGFSPIGFRWMWRPRKSIRPYLEAKGGGLIFDKKVLSPASTYENFSFQSALGMQVMMTPRVGLRLGLFSDFHFSNAFIHDSNPGLDVMNANLGLSYHFGEGQPGLK